MKKTYELTFWGAETAKVDEIKEKVVGNGGRILTEYHAEAVGFIFYMLDPDASHPLDDDLLESKGLIEIRTFFEESETTTKPTNKRRKTGANAYQGQAEEEDGGE